ncbi:MAG: ThuA domain-containing protein [Fibrobacteria bacterium]
MTRIGLKTPMARLLGIGTLMAALAAPGHAQIKVFVFKGFFGYDHSARNTATAAIKTGLPTLLGATPAFTVDESDAPAELTAAKLAGYEVLVLNNNTGIGGLTTAQRAAVMGFGQTKGIVAFHSSADFKGGASWPEMVTFIGGSLDGHSAQMAKLKREMPDHPINAGLGAEASMNDEWYGYATNPRNVPGTIVLTNVDETTMKGLTESDGKMGDHPISWCRTNETGGRMFYTAMGHRDSIMQRNSFARRQLYNAILWVGKATGPSAISTAPSPDETGIVTGAERGTLRVSFPEDGEHSFIVGTMDGRRLETRRGTRAKSYSLSGLRSGTVYVVTGRSHAGKFSKLVSIP